MREGRCMSLIERLKQGSELKSTLSIGKLFQLRTVTAGSSDDVIRRP